MADHLDVDTDVLEKLSASLDETSAAVDQLRLPSGLDAGRASADLELLLAEVSAELGAIAESTQAMAIQVSRSAQLYIEQDAAAAEALLLEGGGE